ncbi:MAG TPA: hypothetical protein VHC22_14590 [Pirellulales bacterium]|nr:hypothetical protein [Pirellulales bacterium]
MIDLVTRVVIWLNALANAVGGLLLAPLAVLPGWLSATLAAAVTGVGLLLAFKYTSNQQAIKRVKDDIKANLLALKLFKESTAVTLAAQGAILVGAARLALLAIVPMLVMFVPVLLILGQLSLWYQARPLRVDEEAIITLKRGGDAAAPEVRLALADEIEVVAGPVRVPSEHEVCWRIKALKPGRHRLKFHTGDQVSEKELAVGDGFMRVSTMRPDGNVGDLLMHPAEAPFDRESPIRSITIDYPGRSSWTSGADTWVAYWFAASMVFGFAFRRALNVNV